MNTPPYHIRPVTSTDIHWLARDCWPDMSLPQVQAYMRRIGFFQPRMQGLIVVSYNGALGYGQVYQRRHQVAEISDLIVNAFYRSQGVGTALITALMHTAATWPVKWLEIGVTARNTRAHDLYERLGFVWAYDREYDLGEGVETVHYLRQSAHPDG